MSMRFADKVAIVTGGCQGIGKGIVEELVANGGNVVVFDIKDELGDHLRADLTRVSDHHGEVHYMRCDLTKEGDIKSGVQNTINMFGGIDLLVNNAGWHPPANTIDGFSGDDFRSLLDLNLVAYFLTCKYALPHLRKSKGNIVNIGSLVGQLGQKHAVTYSATKAGIVGMTKTLAIDESQHGVRVNVVSPGSTNTPLMEEYVKTLSDPRKMEEMKRYNHFQRFGTPREVGKACLYLALDATYTTGFELNVGGGMEVGFGMKE